MRPHILFLACLLVGAPKALAQSDQNWGAPEVVEVQAPPGPALWHLTRGASEVWILGTVGAMPEDMKWNRQYISDHLEGARAIIMPPRPSIAIFEGAWFLIQHGSELSLSRGQKLEASLPDPMRAHFVAVRASLGKDESRYSTDTPLRAALRLQQDLADKYNFTFSQPGETIRNLARDKHVQIAPVSRFEVLDAAEDVLKLNMEQQRACLAQSLDDVVQEEAHAAVAAQAWAIGDIKTVKANYTESRLADCVIAAVHSVADINERTVADYTSAIDAALDKPGKSIAVINIGPLLRKNGVLERLSARNIAIDGPAG